MLAPIHRIQFSMVCKTLYHAADPDLRIVGRIIKTRLRYQCLWESIKHGASIGGDFLLDCLYGVETGGVAHIVFDVGAQYVSILINTGKAPCVKYDSSATPQPLLGFGAFVSNLKINGNNTSVASYNRRFHLTSDAKILFTIRRIKIEGVECDIITTEPGIDSYIELHDLPFLKVVYVEEGLIAAEPNLLIKQKSIDIAPNAPRTLYYYQDVDEHGNPHMRDTGVAPIRRAASDYAVYGFSYENA